jgi:hypothetical protein
MSEPMDSDHDPLIERASAALRAHTHASGPARTALIDELAVTPRRARGASAFVVRHRRVAGIAAGIALIAGVGTAIAGRDRITSPAPELNSTMVEFSFDAPAARLVSVVGEFNEWDNHAAPMRRSASGRWTTNVALAPGRHIYGFAVDGDELVPDPRAPVAPEQMFGVRHSVLVVSRGEY